MTENELNMLTLTYIYLLPFHNSTNLPDGDWHTDKEREESTCLSVLWLTWSDPYWPFLSLGVSVCALEIFIYIFIERFLKSDSSTPLLT